MPTHSHSHQPHRHAADIDWAAEAAAITLEGEVLMPYVTESALWIGELCRREELEVQRLADIGSGPGIAACVLADRFDQAVVIAVDSSREMLERTAARAEALGLSERVHPLQADIPGGLDQVGHVDLIWVAMVLHHIEDQPAALRAMRSLLDPGGLLAIAEFGEPPRYLSDDAGRPGLPERLGAINPADEFSSADYLDVFAAAGFEPVADRMIPVHLAPPLSEKARRVALGYLSFVRHLAEDHLDAQDREALDELMDEGAPLGLLQREDAFLDVSRHIFVARAVEAGS